MLSSVNINNIKKILVLIFCTVALLLIAAGTAYADDADINYINYSKYAAGSSTVIDSPDGSNIKGVYVVFRDTPCDISFSNENGQSISMEVTQDEMLQRYIDISEALGSVQSLTASFKYDCNICGIYPVSENQIAANGSLPSWVHNWQKPCEKADLMLISCHADDEQLFFAGILPYYSCVRGFDVQVVYFTDHNDAVSRHQERLNGLWTVGIRNYPVSIHVKDAWADNYEQALANAESSGFTEEMLTDRLRSAICRFQPKVIVSHDENGEYAHGQHMFLAALLENAVSADWTKDNAGYLQRVFLHLYENDPVTLSFLDTSYDELGGNTPFQMTQQGFLCHDSQQWTWFRGWIFGKNNPITKAEQIETYSPLKYGCYYAADNNVALASEEGDFFAGLLSYEEEAAEAVRLEEEALKKQLAEEEAARIALEEEIAAAKSKQTKLIIIVAVIVVLFVALAVILLSGKKSAHSKH